jgi:polysaccharide export outer membrane protein
MKWYETSLKSRFVLVIGVVFALGIATQTASQPDDDSKGDIEITTLEQPDVPADNIGMEAYREVVKSGRYIVGPGDEFLVYVPGTEEPMLSEVLAEGGLFIPKLGLVQVGGLRLREAHKMIAVTFGNTVKVGEIVVQLRKPRQFPVSVVGLVEEPGITLATGVERVGAVIRKIGGLRTTASRRDIRVLKTSSLDDSDVEAIRRAAITGDLHGVDELESNRVDLELYETTGRSGFNPFIEDGDVILVPPLQGQVAAFEAVMRPAYYEFVAGDRVSHLLKLAMGPTPNHDPGNAYLFRYRNMTTREAISIDIDSILAGDEQADLYLQVDDWLVVRSLPEYHRKSEVRIVGEVVYPGYYVVGEDGLSLNDLIVSAGGFTDTASLPEARVVRIKSEKEEKLKDPEAERIRTIPVVDRTEDENQYFIMKSRERQGQLVVNFASLFERGDLTQNIRLRPGDEIVVPPLQQMVMVSGQAASPGAVIYDPSYTVWDYIERAGGFGWRAAKDVRVIKARTGEIESAADVETIEPGDRIWIREKPVRDYWSIFTQTMEVIGQVATVVLLVATIGK